MANGRWLTKFGYNPDVDASTAPEDLIYGGGNTYFPAAAIAAADIDIVSTDVNDDGDPASTGALTLTIEGLDSNWLLQKETVTLDGQTDVHPVNDYLRLFRAYVATAGSTGTNEGIITIDDGAGNTFCTIGAGEGQTLLLAYTIAADYLAGYLYDLHITVASSNATAKVVQARLQTRTDGGAWQTKTILAASTDGLGEMHWAGSGLKLPPKTDIRVTLFDASADNIPVAGHVLLYLREAE